MKKTFDSPLDSRKIFHVLKNYILQSTKIQQILSQEQRLNAVKSEPPHPNYDIIISVLNPQPETLDFEWNVVKAVDGLYSIH